MTKIPREVGLMSGSYSYKTANPQEKWTGTGAREDIIRRNRIVIPIFGPILTGALNSGARPPNLADGFPELFWIFSVYHRATFGLTMIGRIDQYHHVYAGN